jgi:dienelactone hydrolase
VAGLRRVACALEDVGFLGDFHASKGADPRPGVLVIGGSTGGLDYGTVVSTALAQRGLPSLGVAYHKAPGLSESLRRIPLEYFEGALRWLAKRPEVDPRRLVVMGASRGSEAALLVAVHFRDQVAGVVALVPGNVVLCSWPPGAPAWTLNGEPLPFTDRFGPGCDNDDAVIPVEKIKAPVFLVSAGRDEVWPSSAMARAIVQRRHAAGMGADDRLIDIQRSKHRVEEPILRQAFEHLLSREAAEAWGELLQFIQSIPPRAN